ncbi:MAG: hypothetical protein IPN42_10125 [Methylococcaceae bacterium]|nr:hypothetical protein [Methylococcaceae bacterium]
MFDNIKILVVVVFLCVFFSINPLFATEFGNTGFSGNPGTNGGANCSVCHVPAAPKSSVILSGPSLVQAGQTYNYAVTVQGGPGIAAGVNISTSGAIGLLSPIVSDLSLIGRELTHVKPKAMVSNQAVFRFRWTAPTYNKTVILFAAGNSTDGKHNLLGDNTSSASLLLKWSTVQPRRCLLSQNRLPLLH